jgi:hypothetical protein
LIEQPLFDGTDAAAALHPLYFQQEGLQQERLQRERFQRERLLERGQGLKGATIGSR